MLTLGLRGRTSVLIGAVAMLGITAYTMGRPRGAPPIQVKVVEVRDAHEMSFGIAPNTFWAVGIKLQNNSSNALYFTAQPTVHFKLANRWQEREKGSPDWLKDFCLEPGSSMSQALPVDYWTRVPQHAQFICYEVRCSRRKPVLYRASMLDRAWWWYLQKTGRPSWVLTQIINADALMRSFHEQQELSLDKFQ
jgi:hypothetical protein